MEDKKNEMIVVSLGGSLIVPGEIDWKFLKKFRKEIIRQIEKGKRFIIVTGGGDIARKYQTAAGKITELTANDMDWSSFNSSKRSIN